MFSCCNFFNETFLDRFNLGLFSFKQTFSGLIILVLLEYLAITLGLILLRTMIGFLDPNVNIGLVDLGVILFGILAGIVLLLEVTFFLFEDKLRPSYKSLLELDFDKFSEDDLQFTYLRILLEFELSFAV